MKTSNTDMVFSIGNLNYLKFKYGLQTMNRSGMLRIGILGRKPKPTHKISLPKNFRANTPSNLKAENTPNKLTQLVTRDCFSELRKVENL